MEIRVYDREYHLIGITEDQTSLIWTRRFFEPGEFKITAPITQTNIALYQMGNIISYTGAREAGIVENIILKKSHKASIMEVSGRFLESYFTRRLTSHIPTNYSGTGSEVMKQIVLNNIRSDDDIIAYPHAQVETEGSISIQCTAKEICKLLTKIGKATGTGFRLAPRFVLSTGNYHIAALEIYTGYDRSVGNEHGNAFVEFSDRFDNLKDIETRYNTQALKNYALVGGEGEGIHRTYAAYSNTEETNFKKREIFVDAKDIDSTGLTEQEYIEKLQDRGRQKCAETEAGITVEATVDPNGNFKYKTDYDLGDIVTIRESTLGIDMNNRITEIMEVYEHEIAEIIPTFGTPLPTSLTDD